ncbi:cysteine hydrolase family protein [Zooshikella harenae]|uniref:Cysteine hydrolase n=1 Tax=Zooshikella harenae TaxID=2827238 RepID=A0ABS5ZCL5_9GAMM|nr:cysteine hydrolase [Zooshikella harenae]MBU2711803.1 cysteine hydrolase [Zooshikella harenae]
MLTKFLKSKTAFVFIEFQHEWIGENAPLKNRFVKDRELFDLSVSNAAQIITKAREKEWMIVHAGLDLSHDPEYLVFAGGTGKLGLAGAIPKVGTWQESGSRFVPPFCPEAGEFIVKGRAGASVLKHSTLDPFLRHNGISNLVLMGFATHVCVESTLRDAHDSGYNCIVVTDACGAFEQQQADYFEKHVLHHFGEGCITPELLSIL